MSSSHPFSKAQGPVGKGGEEDCKAGGGGGKGEVADNSKKAVSSRQDRVKTHMNSKDCNSIDKNKTCTVSTQTKSQHEKGEVDTKPHP